MLKLINCIKRKALLLRIRFIERQYKTLNQNLTWYEEQLKLNQRIALDERIKLMRRRNRLVYQLNLTEE